MARTKLKKILEVGNLENVHLDPVERKGKWPRGEGLVLELGCGHGQYVLSLAEQYPEKTFIGMDRKGDRIWRGAKMALQRDLGNAIYIKGEAENLLDYFEEGELDEIWITFPDPFSKPSRAGHRLTSPRYLPLYKKIVKPGGFVHLKTDNDKLFDYSLETFEAEGFALEEVLRDLHKMEKVPEILKILTYYEQKFMKEGIGINYLRASV